ncbi:MAG: response regulator [Helicobacteraceae bacterium]|nr:response regulator [Helicobacteraceae bacterium]
MSLEKLKEALKREVVETNGQEVVDLLKLVSTNANDSNQYLVFHGSTSDFYAKNVSKVEELLVYKEINIVRNSTNEYIIGTADIRGRMTTMVNFDKWMGNEVLDEEEYELVLIASYGGHRFGLVIKKVEFIITLDPSSMSDNSADNEKSLFMVKIKVADEDKLCSIFDSDRLLLDVFEDEGFNTEIAINSSKIITSSKKKIIFCDDSKFIRVMVEKLLVKLELPFEIYNDGKDLLEALPNIPTDEIGLFITDIEMPLVGGREVIAQIRACEKYNDINIIVHTNMANDIMAKELHDAGACDIISKVNMLALGEAIEEWIR